jgi:hypothetical protein
MDNTKVINLLRSVADLLEDKTGTVDLTVALEKEIEENKNNHTKISGVPKKTFLEDLKEKLDNAKKMSSELRVNVGEEKERFFQILKTVEENEKVQNYKNKIIKADEKMESILNGLDELRGEVATDITNGAQKLAKILSKTEMKKD